MYINKPTANFGQLRPSCLLYGREPITLWPSLAQGRRRAAPGRSTGVRTAHWRTIPFGLIVPKDPCGGEVDLCHISRPASLAAQWSARRTAPSTARDSTAARGNGKLYVTSRRPKSFSASHCIVLDVVKRPLRTGRSLYWSLRVRRQRRRSATSQIAILITRLTK